MRFIITAGNDFNGNGTDRAVKILKVKNELLGREGREERKKRNSHWIIKGVLALPCYNKRNKYRKKGKRKKKEKRREKKKNNKEMKKTEESPRPKQRSRAISNGEFRWFQ